MNRLDDFKACMVPGQRFALLNCEEDAIKLPLEGGFSHAV